MRIVYVDANPREAVCVSDSEIITHLILANEHTSNEAEYEAVLLAMNTYPNESLEIRSDSQLVINQINGKWAVKAERLKAFWHTVRFVEDQRLLAGKELRFVWIPREDNLAGKHLG